MDKKKRALAIADELQKLGYPDIADKLREAVTSGKTKTNEQSESNEDDDTGGGNPPPDKSKPDKP